MVSTKLWICRYSQGGTAPVTKTKHVLNFCALSQNDQHLKKIIIIMIDVSYSKFSKELKNSIRI